MLCKYGVLLQMLIDIPKIVAGVFLKKKIFNNNNGPAEYYGYFKKKCTECYNFLLEKGFSLKRNR